MSSVTTVVNLCFAVYMIYEKIQSQAALQSMIYSELPADLQTKWQVVFGTPAPTTTTTDTTDDSGS